MSPNCVFHDPLFIEILRRIELSIGRGNIPLAVGRPP
jgi:hypothetical protein